MRGKLIGYENLNKPYRITPAGAGKTPAVYRRCRWTQDHPRRCGENLHMVTIGKQNPGSPPQVRGKHGMAVEYLANPGITPAGAGKTTGGNCGACVGQDHPRRCGENVCEVTTTEDVSGSPPQVRGKPPFRLRSCSRSRITPAGAGKTRLHNVFFLDSEDHPRRCGENCGAACTGFCTVGSPPQVRGKRMG